MNRKLLSAGNKNPRGKDVTAVDFSFRLLVSLFYSPEYFRECEVDPSSTWPVNLKNNDEAVQYMQSILGGLGGDVFKRVYLTNPGYVVRYIVPGVSELTLSGQDKL